MKYLSSLLFILIFTGCMPSQTSVQKVFQTKSATKIKHDYQKSIQLVQQLKVKLDKRNPKAYNQEIVSKFDKLFKDYSYKYYLSFKDELVDSYKDYLQIAFSKDDVSNRNDYLILGLYYGILEAYEVEDGHQFTSLTYDTKKLETLYKNIQILKWKIKVDRDLNRNYLFLTWQNNWQIELEEKIKKGYEPSWKELQQLTYIKNGQESIFGASNFSYEVLLTQMQDRIGSSLEELGITPEEIATEAIKTVFLFL